jgi:hypothetical protein
VHWTAGFCGIFKQFSGFEFFLLPNIAHARPPVTLTVGRFAKFEKSGFLVLTP